MVLAGRWPDLTSGATKWFNPAAQVALREREGPDKYRTPAGVHAKWVAEGNVHVPTPAGIKD